MATSDLLRQLAAAGMQSAFDNRVRAGETFARSGEFTGGLNARTAIDLAELAARERQARLDRMVQVSNAIGDSIGRGLMQRSRLSAEARESAADRAARSSLSASEQAAAAERARLDREHEAGIRSRELSFRGTEGQAERAAESARATSAQAAADRRAQAQETAETGRTVLGLAAQSRRDAARQAFEREEGALQRKASLEEAGLRSGGRGGQAGPDRLWNDALSKAMQGDPEMLQAMIAQTDRVLGPGASATILGVQPKGRPDTPLPTEMREAQLVKLNEGLTEAAANGTLTPEVAASALPMLEQIYSESTADPELQQAARELARPLLPLMPGRASLFNAAQRGFTPPDPVALTPPSPPLSRPPGSGGSWAQGLDLSSFLGRPAQAAQPSLVPPAGVPFAPGPPASQPRFLPPIEELTRPASGIPRYRR